METTAVTPPAKPHKPPGLLAALAGVPARAYRLCLIPVIYLKMGRSMGDAWRALKLRLTYTGPARRFARHKLQPLHLRVLEHPVRLRQATSDFLVVRQIFEQGEYEAVKRWTLAPGSTLVDLGGNIGLATVFMDSIFPGLKVLAVEPDAANRQLLESNCKHLIDAGRMSVVGAFVAARDGTAGIDRGEDSWAFKKVDPVAGGEVIPCLSVPTLLGRYGIETVDLLKCDIEGTEAELFKNCASWIGGVRHLIVETHAPYRLQHLYDDLRDAGWEFDLLSFREDQTTGTCFLAQR